MQLSEIVHELSQHLAIKPSLRDNFESDGFYEVKEKDVLKAVPCLKKLDVGLPLAALKTVEGLFLVFHIPPMKKNLSLFIPAASSNFREALEQNFAELYASSH